MADVIVATTTKLKPATKMKLGVALGVTGGVFAAALVALSGAVPTKVIVRNDNKAFPNHVRPGASVALDRFTVTTEKAAAKLNAITVQYSAQKVDVSVIKEPLRIVLYVCNTASVYGYGGYGYGGCKTTALTKYQTTTRSKDRFGASFAVGGVPIAPTDSVWFDVTAGVSAPTVLGSSVRVEVTGLSLSSAGGVGSSAGQLKAGGKARRILAAGDLVKVAPAKTIYYLGSDERRYVFPNEVAFKSWYPSGGRAVSIGSPVLTSYAIGGNVTIRPGTYLIKTTSNGRVYAVEPGGVARPMDSEAVAKRLYGTTWKTRLIDVPDAFFVNYRLGAPLTMTSGLPEGTLAKLSGSATVYVIQNGKRRVVNTAGIRQNKFERSFVVSGVDALLLPVIEGQQVTGFEASLSTPAGPVPTQFRYTEDAQ